MNERGAVLLEAPRNRRRISAIDGHPVHVAVKQAHDLPVLQINRWDYSETFEHAPILGERALGRKHALKPRLRLSRMIHRARERFESRFNNMMRIATADEIQMQVHPDLVSHRLHEVVDQLGLKIAHSLLADLHVVAEIRTPADIDNRSADRLVQWRSA